jgi:hypothetical protein
MGWIGLSVALAACGGGGGGGGGGGSTPQGGTAVQVCPTPINANTLNERIYAYLQDWYLWCDQLPPDDPNSAGTPSVLVDRIRYRPTEYDRWSYVDTVVNYTAFFEEGKSTGYGVGLGRLPDNSISILFTEPGSPAAQGGLMRGMRLLAINGYTTAQLDSGLGGGYAQQLGVTTAGVAARFTVLDAGVQREITINSATYAVAAIWRSELLTPTIGYVHVKTFIAPAQAEIRNVFTQAAWQAVTDLVVDLRYNGGGRVSEANRLVSHVLGRPYTGRTFARLQYNSRVDPQQRFTFTLDDRSSTGTSLLRASAIRRVAVITTVRTCSAAEEAIAALRALLPAAQFFIVGSRATCGKPFGFQARSFQARPGIDDPNDPVVSAVNFRSIAEDGTTDYINGFAPLCTVNDDLARTLDDPQEGMRRVARGAVEAGACPPVAQDLRVQPQAERVPTLPDPHPPGVGTEHYTW